jgi:hypothetical protein
MQGSSISAVCTKRRAHPVPLGGVSADQRHCVVRDRIELSTFRFSEGLSSTWEPVSNAAPQPDLPADGPVRSLRQQLSRCANVCRVMPFRPCYLRVGPLREPDLCCCCVGRRSRSAVAPVGLPRTRRGCPRPGDRPAPVTDLVSRPSSYPCGQAGNDAP